MAQITKGALDLAPCIIKFGAIHQWPGACELPTGAVGDGQHHLKIPQQFGRRWWWMWLDLALRFDKQLGLLQNPLPYPR